MAAPVVVKLAANFERNLESTEQFLCEAEAPRAFAALLDDLLETVIPNLERFPEMGRLFFDKPTLSVEAAKGLEVLRDRVATAIKGGDLREYLFSDYLILYARQPQLIHLLCIKHQRQLSFDFDSLWIGPQGR